jgi:murein L,D-transpeptidase YcbB/YkuD
MIKYLFFCSVFILITSCNSVMEKAIPIEVLNMSIQEKMKQSLEEGHLLDLGIDPSASELLFNFYKKNNFNPKWINDSTLTKEGEALKIILSNKFQFGIPSARYSGLKWYNTNFLQDEILITTTLAYLGNDLQNGFMEKDSLALKPLQAVSLDRLQEITHFKEDTSAFYLRQIVQFGPADTNYQQLAIGLIDYCAHYPIDTTTFSIRNYKLDSLSDEKARKALYSKGYIKNIELDSITYIEALKCFQTHNGLKSDGKIGNYTAIALNESTQHKLMRTALTMEKWRWKNEYPIKHIKINIPEYTLRLYTEDTLRSINKIIVGKTDTRTPELTAKINQLVIYPYWVVPQSIASKEILPLVKRNVNYLSKNNFKIFRNDKEINPHSVNWSRIKENTFPYKLRQEFGPTNSLGILKFEFYNKYGVYLHDTPNKNLFSNDIRAFSHGCMRLHNPVDLAKIILDKDSIHLKRNEITSIEMDSLFQLLKNYKINLRDPVPIFVEYKTVTFQESKLIFHPDIYLKDEKCLKLMFSKGLAKEKQKPA